MIFKKNLVSLFTIFIYTSITTGFLFSCRNNPADDKAKDFPHSTLQNRNTDKPLNGKNINFVQAAKAVTPGVVHIKTLNQKNNSHGNFPSSFVGGSTPSMGSGSGVVISSDGYIATNIHVVENAIQIEVIFTDRRAFTAKLIGRDRNTNLALLKVENL